MSRKVSRAGEPLSAAVEKPRNGFEIPQQVHEGSDVFQAQVREAAWLEWELAHLAEASLRTTDLHECGPP